MRKLAGWSALIRSSLPQRCQLRSRRLPILKLSGHPFRSSPTPDTSCFASRQFALNKPDCPPFEAITPSEGTRPASCRAGQGCGSSAASHLSTSRKALRASAGRRNAHLPRPCLYRLSFIVILPTPRASMLQSPCHLDIGAVCQSVLNNWPAISSRRNLSHQPTGASSL